MNYHIHYADGAIHQDNHRELTIQGNIGESTLSRLIEEFFGDPQDAEVVEEIATRVECVRAEEEVLFHFIHPEIGSDEEQGIHQQIKRLVTRFGIQEICNYLNQLAEQHKILLPQSVEVAYMEMKRMGMPNEEGFNYKTFAKYYRK